MINVIHKYSSMPFTYGTADCCRFVADCIEAVTGHQPMAALSYSTRAEAEALIASYGSLRDIMTALLGEPYAGAKDGDACMIRVAGQDIAAVVYRGRCLLKTGLSVTDYPLWRAQLFWSS